MMDHHRRKKLELGQLMAFPSTQCRAWTLVIFRRNLEMFYVPLTSIDGTSAVGAARHNTLCKT
jgi:hypothetical protein